MDEVLWREASFQELKSRLKNEVLWEAARSPSLAVPKQEVLARGFDRLAKSLWRPNPERLRELPCSAPDKTMLLQMLSKHGVLGTAHGLCS